MSGFFDRMLNGTTEKIYKLRPELEEEARKLWADTTVGMVNSGRDYFNVNVAIDSADKVYQAFSKRFGEEVKKNETV